MEKREIIDFTIGLYQLTLLFPKKEPLRYKIREIADEILADFLKFEKINFQSQSFQNPYQEIIGNLEVLDSFLEVAKSQNWLNSSEILKFQETLSKIKDNLSFPEPVSEAKSKEISFKPGWPKEKKNLRYQKILEVLREKGKAQVWELKKIFPQVSKRTLRRDFEQLVSQGLIERIGEKNNTFYKLKS